MTADDHEKETLALRARIKVARAQAKNMASLNEKLEKLKEAKTLEALLQEHQLKYFDLVQGGSTANRLAPEFVETLLNPGG